MYRIIQSYNTFEYGGKPDSEREKAGFSTVRNLVKYLKKSYEVHKNYDFKLYTDRAGLKNVEWMDSKHIEIVDFPIVDDRIPYTGKFQVQDIQDRPYIHVDLDATLFNVPLEEFDIVTEKTRPVSFGKELSKVGVERSESGWIICSGIIGFSDIEFKNKYVNAVFDKIKEIEKVHDIDHKACYTIEETLLTNMAGIYKKCILELNAEDYEHLQGNIK